MIKNYIELIISGIWIEIVHNLKGLLDSIKGIFYRQLVDKVERFYSAPKYLLKPMVRI